MNYETILVDKEDHIAVITLNRPKVLNALSFTMMKELAQALQSLDQDESVRCIVITGNEKAFSAGADIKDMGEQTTVEMLLTFPREMWEVLRHMAKPIIAAVSGYALGGGCELALACDMIVASETARFGQPEINIGIIPGAGGTQRLPRIMGKYKATEMVLTGKHISVEEAQSYGLVNRVVPAESYLDEAKKLARKIASQAPVAVRLAKLAINKGLDTSLEIGLEFEKECFHVLFASEDKQEGMKAFIEKRKPEWKGR